MSHSLIVYHALFVLFLIMNSSIKKGSGMYLCGCVSVRVSVRVCIVSRARPFTQYEEKDRVWSSSRMRLVSLVLEFLGPVIGFK